MRETKQTDAQRAGHTHAEAFCMMLYRDNQGHEEWIWNSRDGVTPFIVTSKHGTEMQHVEWYRDKFAPDHKPKPGERIFVNLTFDSALPKAREYVEAYWNHPEMPMSKHEFFAEMSKEAAAEHFAKSWVDDGNQPTVEEVRGLSACLACIGVSGFEVEDAEDDTCQACGRKLPGITGT